jgi:hypothetical protein
MPDGYEAIESINGVVSVRRKKFGEVIVRDLTHGRREPRLGGARNAAASSVVGTTCTVTARVRQHFVVRAPRSRQKEIVRPSEAAR